MNHPKYRPAKSDIVPFHSKEHSQGTHGSSYRTGGGQLDTPIDTQLGWMVNRSDGVRGQLWCIDQHGETGSVLTRNDSRFHETSAYSVLRYDVLFYKPA